MALRVALLLVVSFLAADAGTPAQDRTAHFDSDGVQIHYVDRGRGEPVVLIRGVMVDLEVVEIAGASHASSVRPSAEPLVRFLDRHRAR